MIFRITQKLNAKIKAGDLSPLPLDEELFADWSAHLFVVNRTQLILLSNTQSLYSTVILGAGIRNDRLFIERALIGIQELLEADGHETIYRKFIAPACQSVRFAKALSRPITGSMSELTLYSKVWLIEGGRSLNEVRVMLNDALLSAVARSKTDKYGTPREAFKRMISSVRS